MQLETKNPYRIIESLGEGGMGEVFLAFDSRLKRQVAVKRLKESLKESDHSRRRFQREAQLAASLNHYAIVQIYDVLEWEQAHWLVMEYVAGRSLRQILADSGPLSLKNNIDLAHDLASGLDHAHQRGIIHRDLKAENVLFETIEQPKIADFGIAKSFSNEHEDQNLTETGAVIGTAYSMAPEQAMGRPAEIRSDLFSLGVLLYESVTGRSPFRGQNQYDTLQRILHHQPEPVRRLRPEVMPAFSDLIMHLLDKKPELRPRHAHALLEDLKLIKGEIGESDMAITHSARPSTLVAAPDALPSAGWTKRLLLLFPILLASAVWWFFSQASAKSKPLLRIGILKPEPTDPELQRLSEGVDLALRTGLNGIQGLSPIAEVKPAGQSESLPAIGRTMAADELLRYHLDCDGANCTILLERFSASDGQLIWQANLPFTKRNELLLARAITSRLAATYARNRRFPDRSTTLDGDDYATYLTLVLAFRNETMPVADLAARLGQLRRRSPDFLEVYLLEANVRRALFLATREPEHLEQGFALTEQAKQLQPQNPKPHQVAYSLALSAGRLDQAATELEYILPFGPDRAETLRMRANMAERQKNGAEALRLFRQLVEQAPSARNLYDLANLERRQGLVAAAREHYLGALEKDPHYLRAKRNLAGLELINGEVSHAETLLKELVQAKVGNRPQALTNLSLALVFQGKYEQAVTYAAQASKLSPKQIPYVLNHADTLAVAGRADQAETHYLRVLSLVEAELDQKRFLSIKAQALAQLGRRFEAVQSIQDALSLGYGSAYDAALVYSLAGDQTSALLNATKALKSGYDARWFSFPWFDKLRDSSDFRARLAVQEGTKDIR